MNSRSWTSFFEWKLFLAEGRALLERHEKRQPARPRVDLKPDIHNVKFSYNAKAQITLADVEPKGLLIHSQA